MKKYIIVSLLFSVWDCACHAQTRCTLSEEKLLRKAQNELSSKKFKESSATLSSFFQCFPSSSEKPQALVANIRVATHLLDPVTIERSVDQLEKEFPKSQELGIALLLKANFLRDYGGDTSAGLGYYWHIAQSWPGTLLAAQARIRINDHVLYNQYKRAIVDNEAVLKEFPNLVSSDKQWVLYQNATYYYQLNDLENSRKNFIELLSLKPSGEILSKAQLYLKAIEKPLSPEGMIALFEKGSRYRVGRTTRNLCWQEYREFKQLANEPFFKEYCNDKSIASEDRAKMLYRLIIVDWELGNHDGIMDQCDFILENLNPQGITRFQCLYALAYHHAHCGHYSMASDSYKELLSENVLFDSVVPDTYRELAYTLESQQEYLDAALHLDAFCTLYPYRFESKFFQGDIKRLLTVAGENAQLEFDQKRLLNAKKLITDVSLITDPIVDYRKNNDQFLFVENSNEN